jgi:ABC-type branched-subunit amino acid transport system substrate-binding protein
VFIECADTPSCTGLGYHGRAPATTGPWVLIMAKKSTHSVRSRLARRPVLGLALGLPLGAACSLALDLDSSTPCSNDSECEYTTGQGTCVDGFCRPPGGGEDSTSNDTTTGPGPTTEAESTTVSLDSTSDGGTTTTGQTSEDSSTGPLVECTLNSECNDDQRCSSAGFCANLLSPECNILQWPEDGHDDVVFLGSIMSTSGIFANLVQPLENAFQLAVEDFNEVTAGLQDGSKIAWVGCDATPGVDAAVAAAEHLRDNVEAPAIVGPIFSEQVREVAEQVTVPAGMFVISPTASAPSLSNFDDDNLVWRVTPNDVYQGNALIDRFVGDLSPAPERMLVLNKDDSYGNELRDLIQTDLFNNVPTVHFDSYPPPETFATQEDLLDAYGDIIGLALAQPGIAQAAGEYDSPDDHYTHVLIIGTSEAEAFIVTYLGIWAQLYAGIGAPFPLVTTSHGAVPNLPAIVANVGVAPGTEPLLPLRPMLFSLMRGTSPNIFDPENFTAFNIRYKIRFNDQDAITSSSLGYDAALSTMLAMVTIPAKDPITGAGIAAGMASLNDAAGTAISCEGPVAVFLDDARNALASGNTIDLQCVSGALDWDPGNGEIRADVLGWQLTGTPDMPALNARCLYSLNPEPAEDGTWLDVSNPMMPMPPCD